MFLGRSGRRGFVNLVDRAGDALFFPYLLSRQAAPAQMPEQTLGSPAFSSFGLVYFGVVVAVGVLDAGDHLGSILNFQVRLENLNVHLLAFCGLPAGCAGLVEGEVTIVGFKELREGCGGGHRVELVHCNVEGRQQDKLSHESLSALNNVLLRW